MVFSLSHANSGDPALVRRVLDDLPDWFAIPEAVDRYVAEARSLPMIQVCTDGMGIGFASLQRPWVDRVEISCMGVLRDWHGKGAGRALIGAVTGAAHALNARLLMVKTLGPSHPDPFYASTRRFYSAAGFLPLAELPEIWGPEDPCLIMVRPLAPTPSPH